MLIAFAKNEDIKSIIDIFREGFPGSVQWQMNFYNRLWIKRAIHNPCCEIWTGIESNELMGVLLLVKNYERFLFFRHNFLMRALYLACLFSPGVLFRLPKTLKERIKSMQGNPVRMIYSLRRDAEHGVALALEQIVIRKKFRGKGFGEEFIAFAQERAERCGFSSLILMVNKNNRSAYRLYEKCGFLRKV